MWPETQAIIGFGALVAALVAIGTVLWRAASWKGGVDEHRKTVEDHRVTVADFMKEIRDDIKEIFRRLPGSPAPVQTKSPASLTDYGEKLSAFLRAKEWAARTATVVLPEVVNSAPFEIEAFSRAHVSADLDPEMTRQVSACAYEFGIEPDAVQSVLWVELRDELIRRAEQAKSG